MLGQTRDTSDREKEVRDIRVMQITEVSHTLSQSFSSIVGGLHSPGVCSSLVAALLTCSRYFIYSDAAGWFVMAWKSVICCNPRYRVPARIEFLYWIQPVVTGYFLAWINYCITVVSDDCVVVVLFVL